MKMNNPQIPQTDSILELARFWDSHDLTEFDDQLEEVEDPIFERKSKVSILLEEKDVEAVARMAREKGVHSAELMREWILEKIQVR